MSFKGMSANPMSGIYIPPFMRRKYEEERRNAATSQAGTNVDKENAVTAVTEPPREGGSSKNDEDRSSLSSLSSESFQKDMWEALRRSLVAIVNKVSINNMEVIAVECLRENLIRGRGLLCRALMRAQEANPGMSAIFACLVAIINKELPIVGELLVKRLVWRWTKCFKRRDKPGMLNSGIFLAHLVIQRVQADLLLLKMLSCYLCSEKTTPDDIEIATALIRVSFKYLEANNAAAFRVILDPLREFVRQPSLDLQSQSLLEELLKEIRDWQRLKSTQPFLPAELDLVPEGEHVTHDIDLEGSIDPENHLDTFQYDPNYDENEAKYNEKKIAILGDDAFPEDAADPDAMEEESPEERDDANEAVVGKEDTSDEPQPSSLTSSLALPNEALVKLDKEIFLLSRNSMRGEEMAHKILKKIPPGSEHEVARMIVESCCHEKVFSRYYSILAERLCKTDARYQTFFTTLFRETYAKVEEMTVDDIDKACRLFAHLLRSGAIRWTVLSGITLTQDEGAASSRIFVAHLLAFVAEDITVAALVKKIQEPEVAPSFSGIFRRDSLENARFCINFFEQVRKPLALGPLTDPLREWYNVASATNEQQRKRKREEEKH